MLYLIHGKNTNKVRSKARELISIMQTKQPNVSLYKVTDENWNDNILDELISTQGLFLTKYIVTLDKLLENKEIAPIVLKNLKEFKDSDHAWIMIEESVTSVNLKKIEKSAYKIFDFDDKDGVVSNIKKQRPTSFAFADSFASKNKSGAWLELQSLIKADLAGEEIHGVLWWQMKAVYLAKICKNSKDTGLSPYVYQKALKSASSWSLNELSSVMSTLVDVYHEAHRGNTELLLAIEKQVLSL